jgi:hypothetical protein
VVHALIVLQKINEEFYDGGVDASQKDAGHATHNDNRVLDWRHIYGDCIRATWMEGSSWKTDWHTRILVARYGSWGFKHRYWTDLTWKSDLQWKIVGASSSLDWNNRDYFV